jgi:hypothetical protein
MEIYPLNFQPEPRRPIFCTFFREKFQGKFCGKFSTKKCWEKMEFSLEKVSKNRFPRNSTEFSADKMYEKSAPEEISVGHFSL